MFRSSKKKGRKQVNRAIRNEGESSEEDETPLLVVNRHKKRKAKSMVVRSFDEDPGDSILIDTSDAVREPKSRKRNKKKKGTGMGFGGAAAAVAQEEEQVQTVEQEDQPPKTLYDKDALQKLKAEQKVKPLKERIQNEEIPSLPAEDSNVHGEESGFIALYESAKEEDVPFQNAGSELPSSLTVDEEPEDSTEWHDQVAKRAGLSSYDRREDTKPNKLPSLEALKNQLKSTLENIKSQQEDLGNAIMRRQADLQQTEADCKRHDETLKETGKACNYYQALRNDVAVWVGALRDLQTKLKPVFQALLQLVLDSFANAEEEWRKCPEDVFSLLHQMNAVDRTIGYQLPTPPLDAMAVIVDEFGRDVKSQFLSNRDKRYKARLEQTTLESESDGKMDVERSLEYLWSEDLKLGGRKERYEYLQQALRVAVEDLDQEYTSLQKLIAVFDDWKQSYPEEYRQCYAVLSLGDLASTLVQADLCKQSELFNLVASSPASNRDNSVSLLKVLEGVDEGIGLEQGDSGTIQRVLEQNHVVLIVKLLKKTPSACFISSTRSEALCRTLKVCLERIDKDTKTYSSIEEAVFSGIQEALEHTSITILKDDFDAGRSARGVAREQVEHAVQFSCREQANWIQHLLMNMMEHWLVTLQTSFIYQTAMERVLQFVSGSYLLLLSSMDKEVASGLFEPIWTTLSTKHSIFMDSPAYMIQSAPVRAAAMAYRLNS